MIVIVVNHAFYYDLRSKLINAGTGGLIDDRAIEIVLGDVTLQPDLRKELVMEITLYSGGLQANNVVTTINAPAFQQMPNAIQWGGRYFFLAGSPPNAYLEGFIWNAYPRS